MLATIISCFMEASTKCNEAWHAAKRNRAKAPGGYATLIGLDHQYKKPSPCRSILLGGGLLLLLSSYFNSTFFFNIKFKLHILYSTQNYGLQA